MNQPDHVVVLVLTAWRPGAVAWGFMRLVLGDRPLRHTPGLAFVRLLGSGHDGGFVLRPGLDHHGLFLLFDGDDAADRFIEGSSVLAGYRAHAREVCVLKLRATSCRGTWAGRSVVPTRPAPLRGPVAALTRGSVRLSRLRPFWRHSPATQASVALAQGCELAMGLGEAPLLRQATFSLWRDQASMDAYARSGAHLQAIRAAAEGGHLSESMFVRFVPAAIFGTWKGRSLDHLLAPSSSVAGPYGTGAEAPARATPGAPVVHPVALA
ncbi:MAG: spheroidene monooxygenase [Rubrivivax sp.]